MVARGRNSTSHNHCAIDRSICVRWHGVNQFLARRNIHGTFKQTGLRYSSSQFFCICVIGRVDVVRREGWLASDDPAVLDHALHADNTRVDRGNPAIAVLSIGYQSLGSCSRAAGWSAATLCFGTYRTCWGSLTISALEGRTDLPFTRGHFRF